MKKVLFAISVVALALVSCTQFEPETPVTFERASAPSLTVNVTGDNSVAFEVLPGKNTGYYAYAFLKGEVDPATVDAATLLAGKLSGSVEKEVATAAKKDTLKNEVKDLTPNTKYTVVAVASSAGTQTLSKVVGQTVTTTDTTAPALDASKCKVAVEDSLMVISVPFDDPIALTDTAVFVVTVYAKNYNGGAPYYILKPVTGALVPADSVSVKGGNTVEVKVPKTVYVPGAYVALSIGQGSVKNALNSFNAEFDENMLIVEGAYKSYASGIFGQFKTVDFELVNPIEEDDFVVFEDAATVSVEVAAKLAGTPNALFDGKGEIGVVAVKTATGRKVEYDLQKWNIDATTQTKIVLGLDEAVDAGSTVSYSIPKGIVEDLYGNVNKALDIEDQLLSPLYTLADITGVWNYKGTSYFGAVYNEDGNWVIELSDDPTKGNVMLTTLFDAPNDFNVYCYFNQKDLTFTIPDSKPFYKYVEYEYDDEDNLVIVDGNPVVADAGFLITACNDADEVVFDFTPGKLSNPSCWFGYYGVSSVSSEKNGYWNLFKDITVTKVGDLAPAPAPAPAPKKRNNTIPQIGMRVIK